MELFISSLFSFVVYQESATAAAEIMLLWIELHRKELPVQLTEEAARGASPSYAVWSDSACLRDWIP